MKHIVIISLLLCVFNLSAQSFFKNTRLSVGFAAQEQDRRSSNLGNSRMIAPKEGRSRVDFEYNVVLHKPVLAFQRLEIAVGLGYSLWRSDFSRSFNHFEILRLEFGDLRARHIGNYNIHKMVLPVTTRFYIDRKKVFNVQVSALPSFAFHRRIVERFGSTSINYDRWEFSPYNLEINPGVGFKAGKKFEINLNYRAYNLAALDRIIFNGTTQKTDTYNPFKLWLSVGYVF